MIGWEVGSQRVGNPCVGEQDNQTLISKSLWRWYIHTTIVLGTSTIDWAQLRRFHLKTETESCIRNAVF
jgi:hypothetical protein